MLRQPQIIIQWATETEVNTAGFNLYRAATPDGPFDQINDTFILGAGDPLAGAEYEFVDSNVQPNQNYYYQLEEVEIDGRANRVDLVDARARGAQIWVVVLAGIGVLVGIYLLFVGARQTPLSEEQVDDGRANSLSDPGS